MHRALAVGTLALGVLAASAVAMAAIPPPGRYVGKARPGTSMVLRVTASGRVKFTIRPRAKCGPGTRLGKTGPDRPPKIDSAGRFRYRESGRLGDSAGTYRYRISGRVTATKASGTYRGVDRYPAGAPGSSVCTARVRWTAVRR